MNDENVIRMAREAGWGEFTTDLYSPALKRFAELIVRECLEIIYRKEYSYHDADPLWETAELIKERFGVKE